MKVVPGFFVALILVGSAMAQHAHGDKGPKGGPMEHVAGLHAELLVSGKMITINIYGKAAKPIATKGFSGSALITRGSARETVKLEPLGENALTGSAAGPVDGATIAVTLKTAAGTSGQARFQP